MIRVLRTWSVGVAVLLLTSAPAWAQATAELNGRVTDESGAVLPGVSVTATQTETGFTRTVVTGGDGNYVITSLQTGPYRLEVSLQGFRTYVQTGIVLQVGATPTVNASLGVGSLEETVSVEAATPLVDVRSAGISEVVEQERILELPLQGRQVTDLIILAGAAVQSAPNVKSMPGSVFTAVAGGLPFGVAYLLDGATHNNPYDNLNMPLPFPDALQEFRVATSGLSADNGVHSGGSVNAVTKSGTNAFHGALFEFMRDKRFNAPAHFAPVGPDGKQLDDGLKRHQVGGTFGGPIVTDKLFFFGGYQGTFLRVTPADATTKIPTAEMLAGDFTAFASPACNRGTQVTLRAPFVNNRVDPALFSPAAMNIAKRLPSTTNPCGDVLFSSPIENDMGQIISKVDYQMNGNHSMFGRYMVTFDEQVPGYPASGNVLTTRPEDTAQKHTAHSLTGGDTMVFGSNMVNSFRVAWNRTNSHYHLEEFFGPEQVGVKNFYNYVPGVMALAVNGAFTTASGGSVLFQADTDAYQLSDDVTLIRGNHQLAVGTNITYWEHKTIDGQRGVGLWTFDGSFTGTGLSDLLTGRLVSLEHARPGVLDLEMWYVGAYAQDTWKVGSRVTLNAGLRWEPFLGQNVRNDAVSNFSLDNFRKGVKTTKYTNAPAGLIYPGDPGFPPGNSGLNKQWLNLAPRAGVAWDVSGDGRTAVRASYGLGYDFQSASYLFISATAPPYAGRIRVNAPVGGLDDPYLNYPGGPPHPVPEVPTASATYPAAGAFGAIDPDINSTRAQSWNVIVERQIGSSWQASASYLGSRLDRIWGQVQLNPGVFLGLGPCTLPNGVTYPVCSTTANLQQRRTLSLENPAASVQLGTIDEHAAVGTQDYRALRLSVQRRAVNGVRLSGNYTRSYCFGNTAQLTFGQAASGFLKPDDPSFDRGNCTQDRRHIANLTVGAQTPDFANAVVRALASNWNVSGIINARSGTWLTVTTARDVALIGIAAQRPNEVGDPYGDGTLTNYLNPAGFAYPASGTLGDHVRSSIEGPAYWNVDLALAKTIPIGGSQNVEVRLETFNLLNHFNWGNPVVNLDAANFGQILTQTGSPRILQFGIKYAF